LLKRTYMKRHGPHHDKKKRIRTFWKWGRERVIRPGRSTALKPQGTELTSFALEETRLGLWQNLQRGGKTKLKKTNTKEQPGIFLSCQSGSKARESFIYDTEGGIGSFSLKEDRRKPREETGTVKQGTRRSKGWERSKSTPQKEEERGRRCSETSRDGKKRG